MMDDKRVEQQIKKDLQSIGTANGRVIYLEGVTDVDVFFGLLGVAFPNDGIHQQTLVKGLASSDGGSGNQSVRRRIEVANNKGYFGKVFGIVDGDGEKWATLVAQFDPPHPGPLYTWKAYSIESLLPQIGWPARWGAAPDWVKELECYAPYVALNGIHRSLRNALETLDIHQFSNPRAGVQLRDELDITEALNRDQHLLTARNIASEFTVAVAFARAAFATSLPQGLAVLNGKWLFKHFLPTRLRRPEAELRQEWIAHAVSRNGMAEIRDLWQRITGTPP